MRKTGCSFLLAIAIGLFAKTQAQEVSRLPPIERSPRTQDDTWEVRQRIGPLQETQDGTDERAETLLDGPVHAVAAATHDEVSSESITLASLRESILSGDVGIDVGGYVKADFIHDFSAIGSTDAFDPLTIPTDGRSGENTRLHARQTRLNLDFRPYEEGEDLRLFIEGDFFGSNDSFRLRHAYVHAGPLLAGQTWSTFMDESILPRTLDFESPRSVILDRRGLLRWTHPVAESFLFAIALEDPQALLNLESAPPGGVEQAAPDLIARVRHEHQWGHLQYAGLVRLLRYREASGVTDDAAGWGFNFTGRLHLHECSSFLFQFTLGEGFESYRQGTDAAVDASGRVELTALTAWVVGYEIDWTDWLSSTFVYSFAAANKAAFVDTSRAQASDYLAANIMFEPIAGLSYGVEYLYGRRKDIDASQGEAHRLQMSIRYDLP